MFLHVQLDKFCFVEAFDFRHEVTHVLNNFLHVSSVSCKQDLLFGRSSYKYLKLVFYRSSINRQPKHFSMAMT